MKNNLGLFVTGICIGIFLGLSDSPILLQVLVPFLTILTGLLSIFTGQKNHELSDAKEGGVIKLMNLSSIPIMLVVVGMVLGSVLGMLARNYDIFSPCKKSETRVNVLFVPFNKGDTSIISNKQIKELILQLKTDSQVNVVVVPFEKENISNIDNKAITGLFNQPKNKNSEKKGNELDSKVRFSNTYISQSNSSESKKSETILHDDQVDLCKIPNICNLTGLELVLACKSVPHYDIKSILKSPNINTDSLKSKINQKCNCNH